MNHLRSCKICSGPGSWESGDERVYEPVSSRLCGTGGCRLITCRAMSAAAMDRERMHHLQDRLSEDSCVGRV